MTSLLVIARMGEPVVCYEDGMHLDGVIAWCAYRDLTDEQRWVVPPINTPWAVDFDLPLAKWSVEVGTPPGTDGRLFDDNGRIWGWMATRALARWSKRGVHEIRKRVAAKEMARYTEARSVHIGLGPAKAYNLKLPTLWSPQIRWVCRGDKHTLTRLLRTHAWGIGKHCAKGLGRVLEWTVEETEGVPDEWIMSQRRMPCNEEDAQSISSIRPPYHHNSRFTWTRDPELSSTVIHPFTGEVLA